METHILVEIVRKAQRGDSHAQQELYLDGSKSVFFTALKILRNKEDAEDITQDVFVTVFEKLPELKNPAAYYKWVNQITTNKCMSFLRKNKPIPTDEEILDILELEDSEEETPEKLLDDEATRRIIMEIIDALPDSQRICVIYRYFNQLSIEEIAAVTDTNEHTVKSRLALARNKIRAAILEKEEKDGIRLHVLIPIMPVLMKALDEFTMPDGVQSRMWDNISKTISSGALPNGKPGGTSGQVDPKSEKNGGGSHGGDKFGASKTNTATIKKGGGLLMKFANLSTGLKTVIILAAVLAIAAAVGIPLYIMNQQDEQAAMAPRELEMVYLDEWNQLAAEAAQLKDEAEDARTAGDWERVDYLKDEAMRLGDEAASLEAETKDAHIAGDWDDIAARIAEDLETVISIADHLKEEGQIGNTSPVSEPPTTNTVTDTPTTPPPTDEPPTTPPVTEPPTTQPPAQLANTRGNTVGNISNNGFAAIQGDKIYYLNKNDGNCLYSMKTNGSDKKKLTDDIPRYINVVGDRIYYMNRSDSGVYSIKTDGSDRKKLDDNGESINVVGDLIYYFNRSDSGANVGIYSMKTDGSGKKKLNDDSSYYINVVGDLIYYSNYDEEYKIYSMRTDGSDRKKLNDDYSEYINVVGDRIYYMNRSDGNCIYSMKTDGSDRKKLNDDLAGPINVVGDRIYYVNGSDSGVYSMKIDGSDRKKLNDDLGESIILVGDWIFYSVTYWIKTDGSNTQLAD